MPDAIVRPEVQIDILPNAEQMADPAPAASCATRIRGELGRLGVAGVGVRVSVAEDYDGQLQRFPVLRVVLEADDHAVLSPAERAVRGLWPEAISRTKNVGWA